MVDVFLIVVAIVAFFLFSVIALYLLVHFQHPDDHNEAYMPKAVVLFGFVLACSTVMLLPLDVANNEGYPGCAGFDTRVCGGLNVAILWNIVFWLIPVWVFVFIPFSTFYYEADDGMLMAGTAYAPTPIKQSRFGQAACYQTFVFIIIGIFFAVMYLSLSDTKIPVRDFAASGSEDDGLASLIANAFEIVPNINATTNKTMPFSSSQLAPMGSVDERFLGSITKNAELQYLVLQVSASTFFAGFMAWIGWFLFAIFGGVGLAAMPLDLLLMYVHRPKHMDAAEFAEVQMSLRERTNELVDIGELIKVEREQKAVAGILSPFATMSLDAETRKAAREERQAILGFKQAVYLLEEDVEQFQAVATNMESYNPLTPYAGLLFGICSLIVSVIWFIHIAVFIFPDPPLAPFLNNYFQWFDSWFPLFGVLSVAIFTMYLLLAAVKGAFKFGLRFLFFHIHPMKVGKTYMSSFMFNIGLVLLCALPVVQFSQLAFSDYASFAEIRQIFGVQIQYLQFFSWFWTNKIFTYALFAITCLTALYLARKPKDQSANGQALRDRLRMHQSSSPKNGAASGSAPMGNSSERLAL